MLISVNIFGTSTYPLDMQNSQAVYFYDVTVENEMRLNL